MKQGTIIGFKRLLHMDVNWASCFVGMKGEDVDMVLSSLQKVILSTYIKVEISFSLRSFMTLKFGLLHNIKQSVLLLAWFIVCAKDKNALLVHIIALES